MVDQTGMGVDYLVIVFDMEVQPLVIHNAAWHRCRGRSYEILQNQSHMVSHGSRNALQGTNEWVTSDFMAL